MSCRERPSAGDTRHATLSLARPLGFTTAIWAVLVVFLMGMPVSPFPPGTPTQTPHGSHPLDRPGGTLSQLGARISSSISINQAPAVSHSCSPPCLVANVTVGSAPVAAAYDGAKAEVFVANLGSGNVSVISDSTNKIVATIRVGADPAGLAFDNRTGEVFVANSLSNNVSVISDVTNSVVAWIGVGTSPEGVTYDYGTREVFVANYGSGNLSVISDTTDKVVTSIPIRANVAEVTYDSLKGEVFAGSLQNTSVVSDSTDKVVASVPVYLSWDSAYDSSKGEMFVNGGHNVSVVSDNTNSVTQNITVAPYASQPCGEAYDSGTGEIFVASNHSTAVQVISDATNSVVGSVTVPSTGGRKAAPSFDLTYDAGTNEVFLAGSGVDQVSVIWDGSKMHYPLSWTNITTGTAPPPGLVVTNDSSDGYVLGYAINGNPPCGGVSDILPLGATWVLRNGSWVNISSTAGSPPMWNCSTELNSYGLGDSFAMVYDAGDGYVLALGANNESWSFHAGTWRSLHPTCWVYPVEPWQRQKICPSWGASATATYDASDGYVLIIATGYQPGPWMYHASNFTQFCPAQNASECYVPAAYFGTGPNWVSGYPYFAMTYDFTDRYVVLLQGLTYGNEPIESTWTYHDLNWTNITSRSSTLPSSRAGERMAFDTTANVVVMYGGAGPPCYTALCASAQDTWTNQTWTFVGGNWTNATSGQGPGAQFDPSMTFDSQSAGVILTPGYDGTGGDSTWLWGGSPPPVRYEVAFHEVGLPGGTSWSVTLSGSENTSSGRTIGFAEPNGTGYSYLVGDVPGFAAAPSRGTLDVSGGPVDQTVDFSQVRYAVWFNETGLPQTTSWSVTLNGVTTSQPNSSIGFREPNGTNYAFSVGAVIGFTALPSTGTLSVAGAPVTTSIAFAKTTGPLAVRAWGNESSESGGGWYCNDHTGQGGWLPVWLNVSFTGRGLEGTPPYTFTWIFADGTPEATGPTLVHNFTRAPSQNVTVTIQDSKGATNSTQLRVLFPATPQVVWKCPGPAFGPTVFGLSQAEGYALIAGIAITVAAAAVIWGARRRAPPSG
jgi:YVTN family beta-propeller protein